MQVDSRIAPAEHESSGAPGAVVSVPELVVVGWVLVRETTTPACFDLPECPTLITISDCIQDDLPRPALHLGDWYQSMEEASAGLDSLQGSANIVTVALARADAHRFIDECDGVDEACFLLIAHGIPLSPSSELLGYEIVGAEHGLDFHSWHCHAYAREAIEEFTIELTESGLLRTYDDAHRVLEWMLSRPSEEAPAPVPWTVVALASWPEQTHLDLDSTESDFRTA